MKKKKETINLLDLIPVQNYKWETNEENLVVILKPKFANRFLAKHILPKMKKPNYRVNLDQFGTTVWKNCNGNNTVAEIADILKNEFGEKIEPVYERLSIFIKTLEQNKFIHYLNYN